MDALKYREQWLDQSCLALSDTVFKDYDLPPIAVGVGFPSERALSQKNKVIGQCFNKVASGDKETYHIFIHPELKDGVEVLGVLTHEIIHALLPIGSGHKAPFVKIMKGVGLEGKPTATHAGPELVEKLKEIEGILGEYPHPGLNAGLEIKKQTTRLLKCECETCGYIARVTKRWIVDAGTPLCPCSGLEMSLQL